MLLGHSFLAVMPHIKYGLTTMSTFWYAAMNNMYKAADSHYQCVVCILEPFLEFNVTTIDLAKPHLLGGLHNTHITSRYTAY